MGSLFHLKFPTTKNSLRRSTISEKLCFAHDRAETSSSGSLQRHYTVLSLMAREHALLSEKNKCPDNPCELLFVLSSIPAGLCVSVIRTPENQGKSFRNSYCPREDPSLDSPSDTPRKVSPTLSTGVERITLTPPPSWTPPVWESLLRGKTSM